MSLFTYIRIRIENYSGLWIIQNYLYNVYVTIITHIPRLANLIGQSGDVTELLRGRMPPYTFKRTRYRSDVTNFLWPGFSICWIFIISWTEGYILVSSLLVRCDYIFYEIIRPFTISPVKQMDLVR